MSWNKEAPRTPFNRKKDLTNTNTNPSSQKPNSSTLLDKMVDGKEFASLMDYNFVNVNVNAEIQKIISEIEIIRERPLVCYVANIVNPRDNGISINDADDLPFNEMISSIPSNIKKLDVVIVTPGGMAEQVAKFVNRLRPRFEHVSFIILNKAMSAGTIFALSGDELIMSNQSQIGPIDPQMNRGNGRFLPAQGLLTLIEEINERGTELIKKGLPPAWSDQLLLKNMDPMEIGAAMMASKYSIELVEQYLYKYKFKDWNNHATHNIGDVVTDEEKKEKALEIAQLLCKHDKWKNHGHAINREAAWEECKLKVTHSESIDDLDRAMRKMWALFYWMFQGMNISKIYTSKNYTLVRSFKTNNGN